MTATDTRVPRAFLRPASKWHRHLDAQPKGDKRLWEVAVLSHLRDGFRSGDIWLPRSRRPRRPDAGIGPAAGHNEQCRPGRATRRRRVAADRQAWMAYGLDKLAKATRTGAIPGGVIRDGGLNIDRLAADVPEGADELILDLYKRLRRRASPTSSWRSTRRSVSRTPSSTCAPAPPAGTGSASSTSSWPKASTSVSARWPIPPTPTTTGELMRLSRWHVEGDAFARRAGNGHRGTGQTPHGGVLGPGHHRLERRASSFRPRARARP